MDLAIGLAIPFLGTTLGAAMVFLMRNKMNSKVEKLLLGFASGVMIAASVWSLLIPSIDMAEGQGKVAWIPAAIGFILGIVFLLVLDSVIPHLHLNNEKPEGIKAKLKKTTMMVFAVTLHNIPEGMAVGVTFAGALIGNAGITMAGAFALAIGIAIQNFPEGAIISMPLKSEGMSKPKAFLWNPFWDCRANRCHYYNIAYKCYSSNTSISFIICSRCNDICGCRRTNTRISIRRTFKYWNNRSCNRICNYDDFGCSIRINELNRRQYLKILPFMIYLNTLN